VYRIWKVVQLEWECEWGGERQRIGVETAQVALGSYPCPSHTTPSPHLMVGAFAFAFSRLNYDYGPFRSDPLVFPVSSSQRERAINRERESARERGVCATASSIKQAKSSTLETWKWNHHQSWVLAKEKPVFPAIYEQVNEFSAINWFSLCMMYVCMLVGVCCVYNCTHIGDLS